MLRRTRQKSGLLAGVLQCAWAGLFVAGSWSDRAVADPPLLANPLRQRLAAPVRFACADTPLRRALHNLGQANRVAVFLDRRVNPSKEITLSQDRPPLWEVFRSVAAQGSAECALIGNVVYVGPKGSAEILVMAAAVRRDELRALPEGVRRRLQKPVTLSWDILATPKGLLSEWGSAVEIDPDKIQEALPHDLWAEGVLPSMLPTDALSLLLIGFDKTFRFSEDGTRVLPESLPPVEKLRRMVSPTVVAQALAPIASNERPGPARNATEKAPGADPFTNERFTLNVRDQPLSAIIEQLARRLKLEVAWADTSPSAEKRRNVRCSFSVREVDIDALLSSVFADTPYTFRRQGFFVEILEKDR